MFTWLNKKLSIICIMILLQLLVRSDATSFCFWVFHKVLYICNDKSVCIVSKVPFSSSWSFLVGISFYLG